MIDLRLTHPQRKYFRRRFPTLQGSATEQCLCLPRLLDVSQPSRTINLFNLLMHRSIVTDSPLPLSPSQQVTFSVTLYHQLTIAFQGTKEQVEWHKQSFDRKIEYMQKTHVSRGSPDRHLWTRSLIATSDADLEWRVWPCLSECFRR